MRWGELGRESPSELEPVWIECPACNKHGCGVCDGVRGIKIDGPVQTPAWCWSVMTLADRYRKGVPPIVGGALDQTNWINQACEFVDAERQVHMSSLGALAMLYG